MREEVGGAVWWAEGTGYLLDLFPKEPPNAVGVQRVRVSSQRVSSVP